jgi:ankyrin repeat protein
MYQTIHYTYRLLLICCLLAQLANCKQCGRNNSEEPSSSASGTSDTNSSRGTPPPSPITDAMIQEVINEKVSSSGYGWELLEDILNNLKDGDNHTIDKRGKENRTALYYAVWLGKPDIVKALLDRNADVNLKANDSYTPFHLALLLDNLDAALLLLESKEITQANLEAVIMQGKTKTALAYARGEEAKGGANQANWQAIIKELQDQGINK